MIETGGEDGSSVLRGLSRVRLLTRDLHRTYNPENSRAANEDPVMQTIGEIVKGRPFYSVAPHQTIYDVARVMAEKDIGAVPVLDANRLIGIFSERDMIRRVIVVDRDTRQTTVSDVMTREIVVAQDSENVESVIRRMQSHRVRHIPVVKGDRVIGFLSLRDLLAADLKEKDIQVQELNTYIYYLPPENP